MFLRECEPKFGHKLMDKRFQHHFHTNTCLTDMGIIRANQVKCPNGTRSNVMYIYLQQFVYTNVVMTRQILPKKLIVMVKKMYKIINITMHPCRLTYRDRRYSPTLASHHQTKQSPSNLDILNCLLNIISDFAQGQQIILAPLHQSDVK